MNLIILVAVLAGTLVLAAVLGQSNNGVWHGRGGVGMADPTAGWRADRRHRPARLTATVWAHRITPTMQPETWGRRRLPRPFRQSGVLPTED